RVAAIIAARSARSSRFCRAELAPKKPELASIDVGARHFSKTIARVEANVARISRRYDVHTRRARKQRILREGTDQLGANAAIAEWRREVHVQVRRIFPRRVCERLKTHGFQQRADQIAGQRP